MTWSTSGDRLCIGPEIVNSFNLLCNNASLISISQNVSNVPRVQTPLAIAAEEACPSTTPNIRKCLKFVLRINECENSIIFEFIVFLRLKKDHIFADEHVGNAWEFIGSQTVRIQDEDCNHVPRLLLNPIVILCDLKNDFGNQNECSDGLSKFQRLLLCFYLVPALPPWR